jgi:hypothetical protein
LVDWLTGTHPENTNLNLLHREHAEERWFASRPACTLASPSR